MCTNFAEASTVTESPFAALAQKTANAIRPAKSATNATFQAPVAEMGPDLIAEAGHFGSWPSSAKELNYGRLSPWEEVMVFIYLCHTFIN